MAEAQEPAAYFFEVKEKATALLWSIDNIGVIGFDYGEAMEK